MDVDGVLNFWGTVGARVAQTWGDTQQFVARPENGNFPIVYSPRLLETIGEWRRNGLVDVRWLTTWEDAANAHLSSHFRWPELPVAGRHADSVKIVRKFSGDIGWWKLEFVQAVYDSGVPVIWTDDDIVHVLDAKEWLGTVDEDRVLAIAPNGGIIPDDLDRIARFLTRWNND
jgi:hypothetical protein